MPLIKTNKNRGETILETIIAMGILIIGITLAGALIGSSLRNLNASKNRIIAVNLAREAVEAMRGIRDTNWLRYNADRRNCWNHDPSKGDCIQAGVSPIAAGVYLIYKKEKAGSWEWNITRIDNQNPQAGIPVVSEETIYFNTGADKSYSGKAYLGKNDQWIEITRLYQTDADARTDSDSDGDVANDQDMYNHILGSPGPGADALGRNLAKKTLFGRSVAVEYLKNDGTLDSGANPASDTNRMRIRVKVWWQEGKNQFKTELNTHLTDYLGREKPEG